MYQFKQPVVPGRTGYRVGYRMHEVNHCPGCGNTQWVIGRTTAECAFCATALPINGGGVRGFGLFRSHGGKQVEPLAA
ncbi:hypothetical protein GCM10023219_13310 [Stakelama sediminis]|uniref:Uncharacterized protein n=1 Tax=Stakelama sediminis TaxID=463200 RepID=A0A840YWX8_9SPHN|nr:hypothetical protein [Stakelama sediminis]MBB5718057.1 hypothetical protein [Stakelama sediminis]